eukprot:8420786-Pyramimonas_sp.AAC.1
MATSVLVSVVLLKVLLPAVPFHMVMFWQMIGVGLGATCNPKELVGDVVAQGDDIVCGEQFLMSSVALANKIGVERHQPSVRRIQLAAAGLALQ